tara:strand:+ start:339 stop:935 length:597 start_codon:yes stop_codon:yes gene_type:complete
MNKSTNFYSQLAKRNFLEHKKLISIIEKENYLDKIIKISHILSKTLSENGTIFFCGNGGSASDANHFTAELIGRFKKNRRSLSAISLINDSSTISCIANDFGYENVFARQIEGLATSKDILFVFSTSGESENIIRALEASNKKDIFSLGLLGKNGGKASSLASESLIIPSESTARIQELHIIIVHILCEIIESELDID